MKYRKKPVVIDAFQWTADEHQKEDPIWIVEAIKAKKVRISGLSPFDMQLCIKTLEGEMRADIGDYIIKGVKGELYPCKPDIFKMTYEAVP
jgi:hypothetical protein